MHLSVANARPRNHEKTGVSGLIPTHLRSGSANLISLLKEYYDFMNQDSQVGVSNRLSHIVDENDIDETSEEYLDAIQAEIASVVPNSDHMDRVTLYKRIVHYYKSKGTLEAVATFFRIFFNTTVGVEYFSEIPWTYSIKTRSLTEGWKERYKKLAHPAGLKFLVGILIDSTIRGGGHESDGEYDASKILAGWDADFWNKRRETYIDTDVFKSSSLTAHLPITTDYSDNTYLTEVQSNNSSFGAFSITGAGGPDVLQNFNGSGTFPASGTDDSGNETFLSTGPSYSTSTKKFGSASIDFGGSHYINYSNTTHFTSGLGKSGNPFEIEFFINFPTHTPASSEVIFGRGGISAGWVANGHEFLIFMGSGNLYAQWWSPSGVITITKALSASDNNTWHHVAFSYDGSTSALFWDGTRAGTSSFGFANQAGTISGNTLGMSHNFISNAANAYVDSFVMRENSNDYDPTLTTLTVPTSEPTATTPTTISPEADGTYVLNGSSEFISTDPIPTSSFYADMDWTISFIYKGTDSSTPILQDSNNNFAIQIHSSGNLQLGRSDGHLTTPLVGRIINDGEEHFCAVENRSGDLTIFVDNFELYEESGFFNFSGLTNINALMRGDSPLYSAPNGSLTYTAGTLKEFRFHNRVFNVEQLRQLNSITSTIGGDLTLRSWLYDLIPPSNRDGVVDSQYDAFHTPKYQPGWLPEGDVVQLLLTFIGNPELDETDYTRLVDLAFSYFFQPEESRDGFFRRSYQGMMKFFDPGPLSGIENKTIADAIASEEGLDDEFRLFSFGADVDSIPYTLSSSVDSQDEGSAFTITLNSNSTVASGTIVNYEFEGISPEDVDELDSQDFNSELLIGNGFFVVSPKVYDGTTNLFEILKGDAYYYDSSTYEASDEGIIGSPDIDVTFDASTGSNGSNAQGYPLINNGQINSVVITDEGFDYQGTEGITFANPAHDGVSPVRTGIYDITTGGSGFTDGSYSLTISAPEALKVGHGGVQATATCTVSGGAITAITITNPGLGYTASPTVSLDGAGAGSWSPTVTLIDSTNGTHMSDSQVIPYFEKATGSLITSSDEGNVEFVVITNRGNGYSVEPPVGTSSDFIGFDSQTGLVFDYLRPYPSNQDTFTLTNDTTTEGSETFQLYLDENPTISVSVVINDTST